MLELLISLNVIYYLFYIYIYVLYYYKRKGKLNLPENTSSSQSRYFYTFFSEPVLFWMCLTHSEIPAWFGS